MRLLLVEDDQKLIDYLKTDLSKAGFAVDVATNGLDGEFLGDSEPYDDRCAAKLPTTRQSRTGNRADIPRSMV